MAKKSQTTKSGNNPFFIVVSVVLLLILIFLGFKFAVAKHAWSNYSLMVQDHLMKYPDLDSQEDAMMLATTISTIPSNYPIMQQPAQLQKYIDTLSKQTGRDIVVVDDKKIILADTIAANIGKEYTEDNGEVMNTVKDGQVRHFTEKGMDYPSGISQTVVSISDGHGTTTGAVIMSSSNIFR